MRGSIDANFVVCVPQVQGFGYGGTNAHAILDDAYHFLEQRNLSGLHFTAISSGAGKDYSQHGFARKPSTKQDTLDGIKRDRVFVINSQDQDGLKRQRGSLADFLESQIPVNNEEALLRDLSFTLSEKRSQLEWRTYEIASSIDGLILCLRDETTANPAVRRSPSPRIGFVFTGQGSQWAGMGIDLLEYTVFRESIEQADLYLRDHLKSGWSIVEELLRDEADSRIDMSSYSQPICTALQIAMVDLLESWNIIPSAMVGHSSGEIAGAYCLGALSKEDALVAAFYRGLLSESIKARAPGLEGGMLAVGTSESEIRTWIEKFTGVNLGIACVNSPSSVTLSGDVRAIDEMEQMLKHTDTFARRLKVANAYHSSHMDVIAEPYVQSMNNLRVLPGRGDRRMHSSVTGESIDWSELGALNWVRNLVSPVLFYDALLDLLRPTDTNGRRTKQNAVDILLEVGPHATLSSAVKETMNVHNIKNVKYLSVLSRKRNGIRTALGAAGSLLVEGVPVRMMRVNNFADGARYGQLWPLIDLPTYSWNHTRTYWRRVAALQAA
jgi:zearalenone synthase (highly reducing iterative type I polyketide synthase)